MSGEGNETGRGKQLKRFALNLFLVKGKIIRLKRPEKSSFCELSTLSYVRCALSRRAKGDGVTVGDYTTAAR